MLHTDPEVKHDAVKLELLIQIQLQIDALHACGHRKAASEMQATDFGKTKHFAARAEPPFFSLSPIPLNSTPALAAAGGPGLTALGLPPARAPGRGQHVFDAVPVVGVRQPGVAPAASHVPLQGERVGGSPAGHGPNKGPTGTGQGPSAAGTELRSTRHRWS